MSPAEIEALVAQVGDEILGRLGLDHSTLDTRAPEAPASAWPKPEGGYAAALELVCASPELSSEDVAAACARAHSTNLPVVWTPASWTAAAVARLDGSAARAGALIDFPNGSGSTPARLADIEIALRLGAGLVNLSFGAGRVRSGGADAVRSEARAAAQLCAEAGAALAVTLEASQLSDRALVEAAAAALEGGADAICSGTGQLTHAYAPDRAVAFLRETVQDRAAVIAGGRIAGFGHAAALVAAGADRIASDDPWALLEGAQ